MILRFKAPDLEAQLAAADPRLRMLVLYAAAFCLDRGWSPYMTVTSVLRPGDSGVHGFGRGADLRTIGVLSDQEALALEAHLVQTFDYSPLPPSTEPHHCAWFETQERALARGRDPSNAPIASHLHLQVPPWGAGPLGPCASLYEPRNSVS